MNSNKKINLNFKDNSNNILYLKEKSLNDFQVQNIEKSINQSFYNKINESRNYKKKQVEKSLNEKNIKELYKQRSATKKSNEKIIGNETNYFSRNLNQRLCTSMSENHSKFDTTPPVGYKRPPTGLLKPIIKRIKSGKIDYLKKEIYLEAISQDNAAGHVFMKYLQSTNKTV